MRPRMHTKLMSAHVLLHNDLRTLNDARTDDKERGFEVHLVEVVKEFAVRRGQIFLAYDSGRKKIDEDDSAIICTISGHED